MRPLLQPSLLASLVLLAAACGRTARQPDVEVAGTPGDTLATPLVELTDAAWLGGRRWAVLSRNDSSVFIADFESHSVTPLGRGRHRQPYLLFVGGDSALYVADWQARAVHGWTLQGEAAGELQAPEGTRGTLPAARDAQGRWYVELRPQAGRDGSGLRDSTRIVRLAADGSVLDTVAALAPVDLAEVTGDRGRRHEPKVFAGRDLWGVHPAGGLWLARLAEHRVDWLADGARRRGASLPDPVVQVTQPDRDLYMERFPPELRSAAGRVPFALFKPAFAAAFPDPAGGVWLEQSKAILDSVRHYLLVDAGGDLARLVRVPGFGHARAAAPGRLLVGRLEEGRIVLEERPLPESPAAAAP